MKQLTVASLIDDLEAEQASLDELMEVVSAEAWELPTPSPGWAVRDQIGHLAFFDDAAALALHDPDEFIAQRDDFLIAVASSPTAVDEVTLGGTRAMSASQLLDHWRDGRNRLVTAARAATPDQRVEWYGPSMGLLSFLTARLMECWAHGQDICDTIGASRRPTDRLSHIADLGYRTRKWTYLNRGLPAPSGEIRVELTSPQGQQWEWGPNASGGNLVRGSALDFCLVTAQRRNLADTELSVTGPLAHDWLTIAQLFAGPPSDPPAARSSSAD